MIETMDIYSKEGDKVVFAYPDHGRYGDQEIAKEYLEHGKVYTVDCIAVGGSSSSVSLKEIPNVFFNTVMFKNVEKKEDVIIDRNRLLNLLDRFIERSDRYIIDAEERQDLYDVYRYVGQKDAIEELKDMVQNFK
ncbi:hypothetical protein P9294_gp016 [Bacillus phage FADO]|uniref:Uncharacterized protein n=1 Tax=Bacillus phage FADO TaxID=2917160 RepID=A0AAE9K8H2_9CAUD|nr:hypothetical protein P9294_gp016 [Bacillus phage FADO]UNY48731.1 hypothetical protein fado_16 [Bacillus phage FADO]